MPLTELINFHEHLEAGDGGSFYELAKTRPRFEIINGISNVKYFLSCCSVCARGRAAPVRQFMTDLPLCRVTACSKPFKFCEVDYFGAFLFRQNCSDCKSWRLLFTCLCSRCIHVKLFASLDINNVLLAFSRITNLRKAVDSMFSDNVLFSTFKATAN